MSTEDPDLDMLKRHCAQLAEHFDTVHIFVTRHAPQEGGTVNATWGLGNWFARRGQVAEWMTKADESTRPEVRAD